MPNLKCTYASDRSDFTVGELYAADDQLEIGVGNDRDTEMPWALSGLNVIWSGGLLASFQLASSTTEYPK